LSKEEDRVADGVGDRILEGLLLRVEEAGD
jgi:hypothetical protein